MQNVLLTLAIPFYENEQLLRKTVESVLEQSVSGWRLIISLDSKLSINFITYLECLNDNRILVIDNESKGICENWNNCIDIVESEYMVILHSDDELAPDYIATMLELIRSEPHNALYFCGAKIIDIKSQVTFSFSDKVKDFLKPSMGSIKLAGDEGLSSLLKGCFIFCPSICYKTEVIKKYKFRKKWQMVLDLDLYARLLIDGYSFYGTNKKEYRYRSANSHCKSADKRKLKSTYR